MRLNVWEDDRALHYRCLLDGIDVSHDCVEASEEGGYVLLLLRGALGDLIRSGVGDVVYIRKCGHVQLVPMPKGGAD